MMQLTVFLVLALWGFFGFKIWLKNQLKSPPKPEWKEILIAALHGPVLWSLILFYAISE